MLHGAQASTSGADGSRAASTRCGSFRSPTASARARTGRRQGGLAPAQPCRWLGYGLGDGRRCSNLCRGDDDDGDLGGQLARPARRHGRAADRRLAAVDERRAAPCGTAGGWVRHGRLRRATGRGHGGKEAVAAVCARTVGVARLAGVRTRGRSRSRSEEETAAAREALAVRGSTVSGLAKAREARGIVHLPGAGLQAGDRNGARFDRGALVLQYACRWP